MKKIQRKGKPKYVQHDKSDMYTIESDIVRKEKTSPQNQKGKEHKPAEFREKERENSDFGLQIIDSDLLRLESVSGAFKISSYSLLFFSRSTVHFPSMFEQISMKILKSSVRQTRKSQWCE